MKRKIIKQVNYWLGVTVIGLILGFSLQFARAWTEPAVAPPGGNVGAPLNTSNFGQSKTGGLILNTGGAVNGLLVANGNVGIGTVNPSRKLVVNGDVLLDGGNVYYIDGIKGLNSGGTSVHIPGSVGIGTTSPSAKLDVQGQIIGGFGAQATGGTTDWNHVSNTRSGSGYTLLLGSHANGPGPGKYFHPFNFEYSSKSGSGNITQFAIPYSAASHMDKGMYMRGRYSGSWSPWMRILTENSAGNVGIGTTSPTQKLDVNGVIRTSPRSSATCNASAEGGIYYDSDDNHFYGCNGSSWVRLDGGGVVYQ